MKALLLVAALELFASRLLADQRQNEPKPLVNEKKRSQSKKPKLKVRTEAKGKVKIKRRPLPPLMPRNPKRPAEKLVVLVEDPDGPESGLVTTVSTISFGIQVIRNNGFTMQLPAYAKGAFNFGVGLVPFSVNLDLMQYFSLNFDYLPLDSISVFHLYRGVPLITAGLGFELGAGNYLRAPAGIRYTFKEMPAQVFALAIILVGPFGGEGDLGINADLNLGFRVLL